MRFRSIGTIAVPIAESAEGGRHLIAPLTQTKLISTITCSQHVHVAPTRGGGSVVGGVMKSATSDPPAADHPGLGNVARAFGGANPPQADRKSGV